MGGARDTLEELWGRLGLDELPPDAGSEEDLRATRTRDWDEATVRSGELRSPEGLDGPVTERTDLPRVSITPPANPDVALPDARHDLVVTGLLGEGGMGRVLLARQESLGREVAVKVARPHATAGTVSALLHEARTTGGLEHPGVIPVYALASDAQGRPALVMKRVDGVSWSMLLRNPAEPAWARLTGAGAGADRLEVHVEILRQVCNAIAFAHKRGVLHRDIKPANVLIGEFGEVYVADWGVATRKPRPGEVRKPSLVGTPVYMAPEMVTGDDAQMDERTDVFLLGATLYELLVGSPPFGGTELREVLEAAWACAPTPPAASVPEELVAICGKAMAARPEDRYQTVLELREALTGYLRHRSSAELARATELRLQSLLASLDEADRDTIYPLLSECRFGFTQALREWPENAAARRGLTRCLEATARFEVARGNLIAARALVKELPSVPPDLTGELEALAASDAAKRQREARVEALSAELDPRVASRQRVGLFAVTLVAVAAILFGPILLAPLRSQLMAMGTWYLALMMSVVVAVYGVALWVGRRSLLSTVLNRRIAGILGLAVGGSLVLRLVAAQAGLTIPQTVILNSVLGVVLCAAGGLTVHWSFHGAAAAMAVGLVASLAAPSLATTLFGLSGIAAFALVVWSWRGWNRGELSLPDGD